MRRVKVDETQNAAVTAVAHRHAQLPTRLKADLAVCDLGFDLHGLTVTGIGQPGDAGFILVTQGQVQRQINVTSQTEFVEEFLRVRFFGGLGRCRSGRSR